MNNKERQTFATNQIVMATLELLKDHELDELSINDITTKAQVSRNAFYRNYARREDIILNYLRSIQTEWKTKNEEENGQSEAAFCRALFTHLEENKELYLLLKKRNLFHLYQQVLLDEFGPTDEQSNAAAYKAAYVMYGVFGWVEQWIKRGMKESGDIMADFLIAEGMK